MFRKKEQLPQPSMVMTPPQQSYETMPDGSPQFLPPYPERQEQPQMGFRPEQQLPPMPQSPQRQQQQVQQQVQRQNRQARIIKSELTEEGTFVSIVEHNYPVRVGWCILEEQ